LKEDHVSPEALKDAVGKSLSLWESEREEAKDRGTRQSVGMGWIERHVTL
jgi:hypothetical protein